MSCRKKIDAKIWNEWAEYTQTMESEVRNLRQEVVRTQDSLRASTKRCRELARELDSQSAKRERERSLRDQQLSRIIRALLVLESRLKQEQKSIRELLCQKDAIIRNQQLEIARLNSGRYTNNDYASKGLQQGCCGADDKMESTSIGNLASLDASDFQDLNDGGLSKDIQKLKCEIMTKLNESLDDSGSACVSNIRKTHSFAGSDISKTSLTSSENTDASIITTTTDGSPSLLSTEGFCEGESTDVSPGSTLNKSSNRCTPTIVTTDSENEVTSMIMLMDERPKGGKATMARSESKDDGLDCNYVSGDEEEEEEEDVEEDDDDDEPIYENNVRNFQSKTSSTSARDDCSNNNSSRTIGRIADAEQNNHLDESPSVNWYSDPDEDRLPNDEILRHSVYRPNSNHNSVLECVNQILLRDMEDEENNVLTAPRRFKHRGKIVRFQPARLSDIESVGSEMERRNSEEPGQTVTAVPVTITTDEGDMKEGDDNEEEEAPSIDGFDASISEDEYGMRIVPTLDPESGLEEDVDESKARPIVIIEPVVKVDELRKKTDVLQSLPTETGRHLQNQLRLENLVEKTCLQFPKMGLSIAKNNLDYEEIESLPEMIIPPAAPKLPPALPPKPQFHNTLILKKIPSPSFLIDETTSRKKLQNNSSDSGVLGKIASGTKSLPLTTTTTTTARSLKFDGVMPARRTSEPSNNNNNYYNSESTSFWKNRFNNVRSSFQIRQQQQQQNEVSSRASPDPAVRPLPKVTNIVKQFEEFKIEGDTGRELGEAPKKPPMSIASEAELDDIKENFEEFNLDECDLSDDPDRPEADGSETYVAQMVNVTLATGDSEANNNDDDDSTTATTTTTTKTTDASQQQLSNGNYDSFLEATGLSNKSILTPSRLLSNHKSMLKPKDVKYKNKIKASAVMERQGITMSTLGPAAAAAGVGVVMMGSTPSTTSTTTLTKHWTGPFV